MQPSGSAMPLRGVKRRPAAPPIPDRELAVQVMEGDEDAFRTLYRRHTPRLWPMLGRMLGGEAFRADAEDVVQEAWIRAVQSLPSFRWQAAFSTWLTGIALNCAREALRKRARGPALSAEATLERLDGGHRPDPERRMDLEEAISALPDGYRAVLVLHDIEGFTHAEISERLEIAVGTSKSQLHNARRVVRGYLEPGGRQESDAVRRD